MDTTEVFRPLTDNERSTAPDRTHSGDEWTPITPVPADAPSLTEAAMRQFAKPGYAFTAHWRYNDKFGNLLGYTVRFDRHANGKPAHKCFGAITYCEGPGGLREWRMKSWTVPRPLYGLDRLTSRMDAPVLVVEGEKTADAARAIFKDHVVVTSPGGSSANDKADWSPLKGRRVTIWPDHDAPGRKYAQGVADALAGEDTTSVVVVEVPAVFPAKWDLADTPPTGYSSKDLLRMMEEAQPTHLSRTVWPAPDTHYLRPELPEPPALPLDEVFSPFWAKHIRNAAEAKAAPPDYVMAAVLTVCSALIGNARWASPWPGWTEPPVLWAAAIGNPSAGKSPALDAVLTPLKKIERDMREKAKRSLDDYRAKAEIAKMYEDAWRDSVKTAIKKGGPEPERPTNAELGAEPVIPRLSVSDTTTEKLAVILSRQPRGILLARDELAGWLQGMSRYTNGSDRPFWLEAHGGRSYSVERMGRDPVYIERLSVGVVGGIQPDRLRSLLLKSDDDGLLARFLPIWPNPVPVKRPNLSYDEIFMENAISRLLKLDMPAEEDGHRRPWFTPFKEDARDLVDAFRKVTREWEAEAEGLLLSFIGKLPGLAVRLSLVLAYLEWASGEVEEEPREIGSEHFGIAAHMVEDYFLPMARRAYSEASVSKGERAARRLVALIRDEGWREFSSREVQRSNRAGLTNAEDFNTALKLLEEAEIIRPLETASGPRGGRPERKFAVNPCVHGEQA